MAAVGAAGALGAGGAREGWGGHSAACAGRRGPAPAYRRAHARARQAHAVSLLPTHRLIASLSLRTQLCALNEENILIFIIYPLHSTLNYKSYLLEA